MGAEFFFGAGHFFLTLRQNAQQAVAEVEEPLFRGHPEVVDADLASANPHQARSGNFERAYGPARRPRAEYATATSAGPN